MSKTLNLVAGIESAGRRALDPEVLGGLTGWERLLDAIPGAVLLVAPTGIIVHANAALARLTGYEPDDLKGRALEVLVPEDQRLAHFATRTRYQRQPRPRNMAAGREVTCRRADGTVFPADIRLAPLPLDGLTYVMATVSDESDRLRREEELFQKSVHDSLTGLPNRVLLVDRMAQAFARARRQGTRVTLFYLDLDGFKNVNDRWGHPAGDQVLRLMSDRLLAAVRPADTVARVGGDEFVVLCEGLQAATATSEIAQRIIDAVALPVPHQRGMAEVTASVGVASTLGAKVRPDTLIETADQAMYRAKRAGGDTFRRETRP